MYIYVYGRYQLTGLFWGLDMVDKVSTIIFFRKKKSFYSYGILQKTDTGPLSLKMIIFVIYCCNNTKNSLYNKKLSKYNRNKY